MAIYHLGVRSSGTAAGAAAWELRTAATDRVRILEIGLFNNTAVASVWGIGRPAAIGVTPTSPVTVLQGDTAEPAGTMTSALAWGTGPTVPVNFLRRVTLPATIGAGIIWNFAYGELIVPVSFSIVIWNIALSAVGDFYVKTDE